MATIVHVTLLRPSVMALEQVPFLFDSGKTRSSFPRGPQPRNLCCMRAKHGPARGPASMAPGTTALWPDAETFAHTWTLIFVPEKGLKPFLRRNVRSYCPCQGKDCPAGPSQAS